MGASTLIAVLGVSCLVAVTMAAPSECGPNGCGNHGGTGEYKKVEKKTEIVREFAPKGQNPCGPNGCGNHGGIGEYGKVEKETKTVTNYQDSCGSNGYGHHGGTGDCGERNFYKEPAHHIQHYGGDYQIPQTGHSAQDSSCGGSKCSNNGGNQGLGLDFLNNFG